MLHLTSLSVGRRGAGVCCGLAAGGSREPSPVRVCFRLNAARAEFRTHPDQAYT
ncbi:MAG: hypothetical protein KF912_05065 [Phycisphaeraceae bacterium]|nr:hypothetical protein [Phycisphaeraceae bacterium]